MTNIKQQALIGYSAQKMYDLVNDVVAYPKFLPWCDNAIILEQSENEMRATLDVRKGKFHKAFTTQNTLDPSKRIEMNLVDGPFKSLQGIWEFEALNEDACKIHFNMSFDFDNKLLQLTLGPLFNKIANTMVDAFIKRAKEVYGED